MPLTFATFVALTLDWSAAFVFEVLHEKMNPVKRSRITENFICIYFRIETKVYKKCCELCIEQSLNLGAKYETYVQYKIVITNSLSFCCSSDVVAYICENFQTPILSIVVIAFIIP